MIIAFHSRFSKERIARITQGALGCLTGGVILSFMFANQSEAPSFLSAKAMPPPSAEEVRQIGEGPLALKENTRSIVALSVEQRLVLLSQGMRPDLDKDEKVFCLGIKGSNERRVVKEGEKMFLKAEFHPSLGLENLQFSEEETPLAVRAYALDDHSLLLKMASQNEKEAELVLYSNAYPLRAPFEEVSKESKALLALREAKWWGQDLFFQKYGAATYKPLGTKQKIEVLDEEKRPYFLLVGLQDFLYFKEGKWTTFLTQDKEQKKEPLAQITLLSPNELQVKAWDGSGFILFESKLIKQESPSLYIHPDTLFSEPKMRSSRQVSCLIGKKRVVLRPGDWLIKTKLGWHILKSKEEIENYLNHALRAELFTIDQIEFVNSRQVIKGHYFNEMRTQMQPLTIPISVEKKSSSPKRKGAS